jgi:uncharacterized protein (TIGR03000 family)
MRSTLMCRGRGAARTLACSAFVLLASGLAAPAWSQEPIYGGIEIGSKGVKATVVEFVATKLGMEPTPPKLSKTSNTTIAALKDGKFQEDAIAETADAVDKFFKQLQAEFKVPPENIYIVGSSGLPNAPNRDDLVAAVKGKTGKTMSFITVDNEVALTFLGAVPEKDRTKALLVDIGSGNTKGGVYEKQGGKFQLTPVSIPLGSVTYATAVKNEAKTSGIEFVEAAAKLRDSMITKPLSDQAASHPALAKADPVYLSGGIVWSMATLLHPDEQQEEYVAVTANDIDTFHQLLTKNPGTVPAPDLAKIRDEGTRKLAESEVQRVKDTFTPDNLLAGSEILKSVSDVLKLRGKKVYFTRYGYIAWISAYVRTNGQPEKAVPGASSTDTKPDAKTKPKPDADSKSKPDTEPKTKPEPVAAFGCCCGLPVPVVRRTAPATIVVQVPAGAKLYVDDYLTKQESATRSFTTPPLAYGGEYKYQFKVEVVRDGKPVTETRQVSVQAGGRTEVDLSNVAPQATQARAQAPRE